MFLLLSVQPVAVKAGSGVDACGQELTDDPVLCQAGEPFRPVGVLG